MNQMVTKYRRPAALAIHGLLAVVANALAFWLRFDGMPPAWALEQCVMALPLIVMLRLAAFDRFTLLDSLWRYTSVWDVRNLVLSVWWSTVAVVAVIRGVFGVVHYPRSVFIMDAILLVVLTASLRLARRWYRERGHVGYGKRLLIYGAGDAGEMLVRDIRHDPAYGYDPIGFIDDDPAKVGRRIHGVPVLGTRERLAAVVRQMAPHEVLIAIPTAAPEALREIVRTLEPYHIPIKTVPDLRDVLDGHAMAHQIRSLSIDDLLGRPRVTIDLSATRDALRGHAVLVTGAGGSIGSELCRQIAELRPSALVLYERYENNLYAIHSELSDERLDCPLYPVIGDVRDRVRLDAVMSAYRPRFVFHAAAHKHVPLMEFSPCEAIKNNIGGTRAVAEAADRHGAERFVLISTDKAVNPTSVMGATKRVAELIVQDMNRRSRTKFMTVRFGNVLGSNGSVVPRFLEQIKSGGPVTVTHPEIRRFFMLIPEAVQLVLQAATLAQPADVYVLDMGEQIKVVDLARNVIRLSGFVPDVDIPIEFVGLRPGEKLYEELVGVDETVERSPVEKINRVRPRHRREARVLAEALTALEQAVAVPDADQALEILNRLVPTFTPVGRDAILAAERRAWQPEPMPDRVKSDAPHGPLRYPHRKPAWGLG